MMQWQRIAKIVTPSQETGWLQRRAGCAFAYRHAGKRAIYDIYISGKDEQNRSQIGYITLDFAQPNQILFRSPQPILSLGNLGCFDHYGVSYPWLIEHEQHYYLYYTGWTPQVGVPYQNNIGIAKGIKRNAFTRLSRAPALPLTHEEPFGTGSCCVLKNAEGWQMWYTCFIRWQAALEASLSPVHWYHIRYATSQDGIHWQRLGTICIDFDNPEEFAICRPTVLYINHEYHMWFCARGEEYHIGYARSKDGMTWQRSPGYLEFSGKTDGFDSQGQCYPHVFQEGETLYLLYSGNQWGTAGLGLARLSGSLSL